MKKDFSPEEKLLRLIRGSGKKAAPKGEEESAPKAQAPKEQPSESSAPQPSRTPSHQEETKPKPKPPKIAKSISVSLPFKLKEINTQALNIILIVILVGLILYFTYDLVYTSYYKKAEGEVVLGEEKETSKIEKEDTLDIKPYSFYSSSIKGRNIFMPQQVETEPVVTGPTVDEIKGGLSLIGIIAGDRPQAIIEDRKSGKSYFLYEGGSVGQSKVVEILDDRVIMDYKGQRFDLVL